jgi:microcystin-dependent protein
MIATSDALFEKSFDSTGKGLNDMKDWYICNGENGAPDLRNRFLVGKNPNHFEYSQTGNVGGLEKVKLTINEMPSHTHIDSGHQHFNELKTSPENSYSYSFNEYYTYDYKGSYYRQNRKHHILNSYTQNSYQHFHTTNGWSTINKSDLSNTGDSEEHENRPPYYVVQYIIYIPSKNIF